MLSERHYSHLLGNMGRCVNVYCLTIYLDSGGAHIFNFYVFIMNITRMHVYHVGKCEIPNILWQN
jgi:hypothetical protein